MDEQRNYTGSAFWITLIVVVMTVGMSLIPGFQVGRASVKRVNILSDLIRQEEHPRLEEDDLYFDTTFLAEGRAIEAAAAADSLAADSAGGRQAAEPEIRELVWDLPGYRPMPGHDRSGNEGTGIDSAALVAIEDFGGEVPAMEHFYRTMLEKDRRRPVRIAVLGDSFIEGDIVTADVRERMQDLYGGCGVGFVPFSSPIALYRATVRHTFDGWKTYDVKAFRKVPEDVRDKFFVSGNVCIPQQGATARMEGVTFRRHIDAARVARILFINRGNTSLHVVVNDSLERDFRPDPSPLAQQIVINGPVRTIAVTLSDPEGFVGYGIELECPDGVTVDNFSIRGNSGLALFGTNPGVNARIGELLGYDLVVLQYGLNVMSPEVMRYGSYAKNFVRVINYMKQCFPGSSVLVMGICDRSMQRDGEFETMPSVPGMIAAQRSAAEQAGVAFWNTFDAMGGHNSMVRFVERRWAAKDYTHIGYTGGKYVADRLVDALITGVDSMRREIELRERIDRLLKYDSAAIDFRVPDTALPLQPSL